jgi:hypothetical protein
MVWRLVGEGNSPRRSPRPRHGQPFSGKPSPPSGCRGTEKLLSFKTLQTLTNEQCAEWLSAKGLIADPYHRADVRGISYVQLPIPAPASNALAMLRNLVLLAGHFEEVLLHVTDTDWSSYSADEMAVVTQLRKSHGDERTLIETPGHLFTSSERDLLIGMMGLVTAYGWTAYISFDHELTVLLWEGEQMDLWDTDATRFKEITKGLA